VGAISVPNAPSAATVTNANTLVSRDQLPILSDGQNEKTDQPQFSGWNVFAVA
jgi:hypothetical protein